MQRRPRFITQGGLENLHHLPRDKTTVLLFPTSRKQSSGATLSNIHCTKLFTLEVGTLHYGRGEDKKQYFISKQILTNIFCCQYFSSKAQRTQRRVRRRRFDGVLFYPDSRTCHSLFHCSFALWGRTIFNWVSNLAKLRGDVCYTFTHVLLHTAMPLSSNTQ